MDLDLDKLGNPLIGYKTGSVVYAAKLQFSDPWNRWSFFNSFGFSKIAVAANRTSLYNYLRLMGSSNDDRLDLEWNTVTYSWDSIAELESDDSGTFHMIYRTTSSQLKYRTYSTSGFGTEQTLSGSIWATLRVEGDGTPHIFTDGYYRYGGTTIPAAHGGEFALDIGGVPYVPFTALNNSTTELWVTSYNGTWSSNKIDSTTNSSFSQLQIAASKVEAGKYHMVYYRSFEDDVVYRDPEGAISVVTGLTSTVTPYMKLRLDEGDGIHLLYANSTENRLKYLTRFPSANLSLNVMKTNGAVKAGDTVVIEAIVQNTGSKPVAGVRLEHRRPSYAELMWSYVSKGRSDSFYNPLPLEFGVLQPGETVTGQVGYVIYGDGPLEDVSVLKGNFSGVVSNALSINVQKVTDLKVTPTAFVDIAGSNILYEVLVDNEGYSEAQNVQVSLNLPAGTTLESIVSSTGTCNGTTCDLGDMSWNARERILATVRYPEGAGVLNASFSVPPAVGDTNTANNSANVSVNLSDYGKRWVESQIVTQSFTSTKIRSDSYGFLYFNENRWLGHKWISDVFSASRTVTPAFDSSNRKIRLYTNSNIRVFVDDWPSTSGTDYDLLVESSAGAKMPLCVETDASDNIHAVYTLNSYLWYARLNWGGASYAAAIKEDTGFTNLNGFAVSSGGEAGVVAGSYYAERDGGAWNSVNLTPGVVDYSITPSIELLDVDFSSDGRPYIAFRLEYNSYQEHPRSQEMFGYMYKQGGTWITNVLREFSRRSDDFDCDFLTVSSCEIQLDTNDNVHLAYFLEDMDLACAYDSNPTSQLSVAAHSWYDGSSWKSRLFGSPTSNIFDASMDIDNFGNIHFSFTENGVYRHGSAIYSCGDLSINKSAPTNQVDKENTIWFTLTVSNESASTVSGVRVLDESPRRMAYPYAFSQDAEVTIEEQYGFPFRVNFGLEPLAPGQVVTQYVSFYASSSGATTNIVTVDGAYVDDNQLNNTSEFPLIILPVTDLRVTKEGYPADGLSNFVYTVVVENHGPSAGSNVVVKDLLPAGVTATSVTSSLFSCSGTTLITCELPFMPVGSVDTITIVAAVSPGAAVIENNASITNDIPELNSENDVSIWQADWSAFIDFNIENVYTTSVPTPVSVLVDSNRSPHISFKAGNQAVRKYRLGGVWAEDAVGTATSVWTALDSIGRVHYVYQFGDLLALDVGGTISSSVGSGANGDFFITPGSNGDSHTCYQKEIGFDTRLHYSHWAGAAAAQQAVPGDPEGYKCAIAGDAFGNAHLVYFHGYDDGPVKSNDVIYAKRTAGGSWTTEVLTEGMMGFAPHIVVDSNGDPHIGFVKYTPIDYYTGEMNLVVFSWNGTGWDESAIMQGQDLQSDVFLAVGPDDTLHALYRNDRRQELMFARQDSGFWSTQPVAPVSASPGIRYFSLAVDQDGLPHIGFYDAVLGEVLYASARNAVLSFGDVISIDEGVGSYLVTLYRKGNSNTAVSVDYATQPNTASSPDDYTDAAGSLNFPAGNTSQTFSVTIQDDSIDEPKEKFAIALSNPVGALAPSAGIAQIVDNDPGADLRIVKSVNLDPAFQDTPLIYTLTVSNRGFDVATDVEIVDNLPPDVDIVNVTGDVESWSPSGQQITIMMTSNNVGELIHAYVEAIPRNQNDLINNAVVSSALPDTNLVDNSVTITSEVEYIALKFSSPASIGFEGAGGFATIQREGYSDQPVQVELEGISGSAVDGYDFDSSAVSQMVVLAAGVNSKDFTFPVIDDTDSEFFPESFTINMKKTFGGATAGDPDKVKIMIFDNDGFSLSGLGFGGGGGGGGRAEGGGSGSWVISDYEGSGANWRFDDPGGRGNQTGGTGTVFAIADSAYYGAVPMGTTLLSPSVDLSSYFTAYLLFYTDFQQSGSEEAKVSIRANGGSWTTVWHQAGSSYPGPAPVYIDITALAAGATNVKVVFDYHNANDDLWWQVADVAIAGYLDADGDGLPDWWETLYIGSTNSGAMDDDDMDHAYNIDEFLMNTDPGAKTSVFKVVISTDVLGNPVVSYPSSDIRNYAVYYQREMTNGWQPLGAMQSGDGSWQSVVDGINTNTGFYQGRVFMPDLPGFSFPAYP